MDGKKILQKVPADDLSARVPLAAQGRGNKVEVLLQRIGAVHLFQPGAKQPHHVVFQILFIGDWEHVVDVGKEGGIFGSIPFPTRVGESLHIQRISAEHTADGIGDERDDLIAHGANIVGAAHPLGHILFGVEDAVHGDVLLGDVGCKLILQAVDLDENAVELLFIFLKL